MERIKAERKITRRFFTKCAQDLEAAIESKNSSESSALLNKLEKHRDDLLRLQNSLMTFWLETEDRDDSEFEKDMDTADTYEKKWFLLKQKTQDMVSNIIEKDASSSGRVTIKSADENSRRRMKLPKFELPVFDGQVKNWIGFWSQFKKIHDDQTELDNNDKMHYLVQAMEKGSSAKELIDSFPPCGENYEKAVEQLKNRFARDEIIIDFYVRELLHLVISKNANKSTRALYDRIMTQILALESLGLTQDKYALFLYPLVESALPDEILRAWNRSRVTVGDDKNSLKLLLNFMKLEVESEERIRVAHINYGDIQSTSATAACLTTAKKKEVETDMRHDKTEKEIKKECIWCEKASHVSSECKVAMNLSLEERREFLRKKRACFICLKKGHNAKYCRARPRCIMCSKRHFTIMCGETVKNVQSTDSHEKAVCNQSEKNKTVLLQTLKINVSNGDNSIQVRALIDSGAQRTFIKSDIARLLKLKPAGEEVVSHSLFGGSYTKKRTYKIYRFKVSSLDGLYECHMTALEQPTICGYIPKLNRGSHILDILYKKGINISDCIDDQSEIQLLIGSDFLGSLLTGRSERVDENLLAMESKLGWTVQGPAVGVYCSIDKVTTLHASLISDVENFWELEMLGIKDEAESKSLKDVDLEIDHFFKRNIIVNDESRYEVKLPWKHLQNELETNYNLALKRLLSTSKRLTHIGILDEYDKVFQQWLNCDIIEVVEHDKSSVGHYIPHHAVVKESSATTKIRPVFDASVTGKNGLSLNACLEKGNNLIELIPRLLIQFRKNEIGITADIKQAFLQISINHDDRDYLKFLWWRDINESPRVLLTFRHRRVVFGITTSPYLLSATILHHLEKYDCQTALTLRKSFYVDNCLASVSTSEELHYFMDEAKRIMSEGKFDLRCWVSGPEIVDDEIVSTSVLGLNWDPRKDILNCKVIIPNFDTITKRFLLSIAQSVFDPLGFLCPTLMVPKLVIQKCWIMNIQWDQTLPNELYKEIQDWLSQAHLLNNCHIPRRLSGSDVTLSDNSFHVFCDASQTAYACCIFLRSEYKGNVSVELIMAKARVAPTKSITIPRIELLAALMGTRLACEVKGSLELTTAKEYYWTDSSIVLAWIKRKIGFKMFVHNRIKEIVNRTNSEDWRHVPSAMNPADLPSRGCNPQVFIDSSWWRGPNWLKETFSSWPDSTESIIEEQEVNLELRQNINSLTVENLELFSSTLLYFSKYNKIVRMVAWCFRFVNNCRGGRKEIDKVLSPEEIITAERSIFKCLQMEAFIGEQYLKQSKLKLVKDQYGILRVQTRLTLREDADEFISPILLPNGPLVEHLISRLHIKYLHAGTLTLLTKLRESYWVLGARKLVNKVVKGCIICRKLSAKACSAPIPPLPLDRIQCGAPFEVSGIDFAGPLYLRSGEKCWIALFTCAVYRAVHLELCMSLSTEEFLLALRRFIARRGNTKIIYTDNGTNFRGASNILNDINWANVQSKTEKLIWRFSPPSAPWWGGFWERMVRTVKEILKRVLGKAALQFNELVTVICEVESMVNARPLTYITDSSENVQPLTPTSFLLFSRSSNTSFIDISLIDGNILSSRWRYIRKLNDDLRQRFRSEYLGLLIQRAASHKHRSVNPGDVVLIEDDSKKRVEWPLGIVTEVLDGVDGISRVARVKFNNGERLRAIRSVYPLELSFLEAQKHVSTDHCQNQKEAVTTRSGRLVKVPDRLTF